MILDRHADPFKLPRVELDAMTAEKLLRDQVADKITDGQTVRLGRFVNRVGGNEAARPGNVIDNDSRVAGYVFTDVASHDPGIRVEATASRKPHDDSKRFPRIEILSI